MSDDFHKSYASIPENSTAAPNIAKLLSFGTFNNRRLTDNVNKNYLVDDAQAYNIDMLYSRNKNQQTARYHCWESLSCYLYESHLGLYDNGFLLGAKQEANAFRF